MKAGIWLISIIWTTLPGVSYQAPVDNTLAGMEYLEHYGYLGQPDLKAGQLRTAEDFEEAIATFQRFANINITGQVDNATMEMMNTPRCGLPDMIGTANEGGRLKRYSAGSSSWPQNDLTYTITQYSSDLSHQQVDDIIRRAFDVWSAHTPLTFTQIYQGSPDINILFARGYHNDGGPFDGPGGVLAHAYFPTNGDAHFDDDELFTFGSYSGINLFQVAAHEFGHSLGLGHSDVHGALMAPFYQGYQPNFKLHEDDILGIQYLYGMPDYDEVTQTPIPDPGPNPSPDDCTGVFDAITRTHDGSTYAFRGTRFWKMSSGAHRFRESLSIGEEWPGLPNNLDAALFWPSNGRTYFFKGDQYWRYYNQILDTGYPKSISIWRRLPSNVDAAFVWSGNGKTYFIKGDQYYRYTSGYGVDYGYPKPLSIWGGLPNTIDAVFQWANGRTYFFSGNQYYRFNDRRVSVDEPENQPPYPRETTLWWLSCSDNLGVMETTNATVTSNTTSTNVPASELITNDMTTMSSFYDNANDGMVIGDTGNNILPNIKIILTILCAMLLVL